MAILVDVAELSHRWAGCYASFFPISLHAPEWSHRGHRRPQPTFLRAADMNWRVIRRSSGKVATKLSIAVVALVVGSSAFALAQNRTSPVQPSQVAVPPQSSQLRLQPGAPNTVPGTAPGEEMLQSPQLRLQPGAPNTVPGTAPGQEMQQNDSMTGQPSGFAPGQPSGLGFAPGQEMQQQGAAPSQPSAPSGAPGATQ